jgi:regulator of sigma E protease
MNPSSLFDWFVPFALLLGILIFIHELGHFLVAKWLGVKVEKFSIGFGPSLLARKVGETEYVIAALPLGGFVKMLGEVPGEELPAEDAGRAFNMRPVWQRVAISLAGPVMNLVLPVLLIAALLMSGVPTLTSRVGGVLPGSAAERAGFREGDRVVAAGGQSLWKWDELDKVLKAPGAADVSLRVEREENGVTGARDLTLTRAAGEKGGWQDTGLSWHAPPALVGVKDPAGPAAQAGLQTGDRIVSLAGAPIENAYALRRRLASERAPFELEVKRPLEGKSETARVTLRELPGPPTLETLGIAPVGVVVMNVEPSSPAKRAGLAAKDLIVALGGAPAENPDQVRTSIWGSEGKPIAFQILRDDKLVAIEVTPEERSMRLPEGTQQHWGVGITLGTSDEGAEYKDDVVRNPLVALGRGVERTGEILVMIVGGLAQLVTGSVGMSNLSGPIGIGEIAADAYQASWAQFVWLMAVISVNLGILNLLPIPVLDGGQIVLSVAEKVRGGPLPMRAREIAQTVGISLILLLMGVAFWNDIARHWSGVVEFLSDLG